MVFASGTAAGGGASFFAAAASRAYVAASTAAAFEGFHCATAARRFMLMRHPVVVELFQGLRVVARVGWWLSRRARARADRHHG